MYTRGVPFFIGIVLAFSFLVSSCAPSLVGQRHVGMWAKSCTFALRKEQLCKETISGLSVEYRVIKTKKEHEYLISGTATLGRKTIDGVYEKIHRLQLPFYFLEGQIIVEKKTVIVAGIIDKPSTFNKFFKTDKDIEFSIIGGYKARISELPY